MQSISPEMTTSPGISSCQEQEPGTWQGSETSCASATSSQPAARAKIPSLAPIPRRL